VNEQQDAGYYHTNFDAHRFASGMYIYRLLATDETKQPTRLPEENGNTQITKSLITSPITVSGRRGFFFCRRGDCTCCGGDASPELPIKVGRITHSQLSSFNQ